MKKNVGSSLTALKIAIDSPLIWLRKNMVSVLPPQFFPYYFYAVQIVSVTAHLKTKLFITFIIFYKNDTNTWNTGNRFW